MFNGLKSLFSGGGDIDMMKMIGQMLPGIIDEEKPKLLQAFRQKVASLTAEYFPDGLEFNEHIRQEIVPFVTMRNQELVLNWSMLQHSAIVQKDVGIIDWQIQVIKVVETITLDELLSEVTNSLGKTKELPEVTQAEGFKYEVSEAPTDPLAQRLPDGTSLAERAGITPEKITHVNQKMKERHDQYFLMKYVVVKVEQEFQVMEGPAPEREAVFFGHNDEVTAQKWADEANGNG